MYWYPSWNLRWCYGASHWGKCVFVTFTCQYNDMFSTLAGLCDQGRHLGTLLSLHRGALQSSLGVPGPGCAIQAHMDDPWPFCQHACLFDIFRAVNVTDWGWSIPRLMAYTSNMIQRHPRNWTWCLNEWVTCSPRHGTPPYSPTQLPYHFHQLSSDTQLKQTSPQSIHIQSMDSVSSHHTKLPSNSSTW
jgi:hypothetical protein